MKKLITILVIFAFLLPAVSAVSFAGDRGRNKNYQKKYKTYDNRGYGWHRNHGQHRVYRHHRDNRNYHYRRHFDSWYDWQRYYNKHRRKYKDGWYDSRWYDGHHHGGMVMFKFCEDNGCFSFSIRE